MFAANFLEDGYTQPGFVAAAPRLHGELRFRYRPALVEERSALGEASRQLRAAAYDRHVAEFLAPKIVSWDLVDRRGELVPIAPANVLRLHPELFGRVLHIIAGWQATDLDPQWADAVQQSLVEEQLEAAVAGRPVGELREEHDEKN